MGGGLMQLVAYGAQDVYLTSNPQITFWKVTYRRHTNFAMESIEQTFNGQADFGRRVTCTISRNGDLAYRTYLQVVLPEINQSMAKYARWLDFPGEQLVSQVEVEIGGQRIDRQFGDWMHIWNQLTCPSEQEKGYYKMIGNTTQLTYITDPGFAPVDGPCDSSGPRQVCAPRNALPETFLYIPLQFWFCRNPGLALPLIALQYHEVRINIDLSPIDECLWAVDDLNCTSGSAKATSAYQQSLSAASLYVDYVFLDTEERRRMAQNPHEYLIEQLQFTGDESVGSSSNKIKLNFNHPCKELIWVVQPDANVDYCSSLECGTLLNRVLGAQPFNYTDAVDALPNAHHAFGGPGALTGTGSGGTFAFIDASGLFQDAAAADVSVSAVWPPASYSSPNFSVEEDSGVSDAGTFVLAETALDMHCWVKIQSLRRNYSSMARTASLSAKVATSTCSAIPAPPLAKHRYQCLLICPSPRRAPAIWHMQLLRIDNATLQLVLSNATVTGTNTAKVRVYATNYNVLRIMSGMGGLAYSN